MREIKPELTTEDAQWNLALFNERMRWFSLGCTITTLAWLAVALIAGKI